MGIAAHVEVPVVESASSGLANGERGEREDLSELHSDEDWWYL